MDIDTKQPQKEKIEAALSELKRVLGRGDRLMEQLINGDVESDDKKPFEPEPAVTFMSLLDSLPDKIFMITGKLEGIFAELENKLLN